MRSVGFAAMLLGAIDPLEGSLLILPGSGLVWLGSRCDPGARSFAAYRLLVLVLLAVGIGAMFALSAGGGLGGTTGRSWAWAFLLVPYLVGWPLGILGPGNPRWVHLGGVAVGLWWLVLPVTVAVLHHRNPHGPRPFLPWVLGTVVLLGLVTVGGSAWRLRRPPAER